MPPATPPADPVTPPVAALDPAAAERLAWDLLRWKRRLPQLLALGVAGLWLWVLLARDGLHQARADMARIAAADAAQHASLQVPPSHPAYVIQMRLPQLEWRDSDATDSSAYYFTEWRPACFVPDSDARCHFMYHAESIAAVHALVATGVLPPQLRLEAQHPEGAITFGLSVSHLRLLTSQMYLLAWDGDWAGLERNRQTLRRAAAMLAEQKEQSLNPAEPELAALLHVLEQFGTRVPAELRERWRQDYAQLPDPTAIWQLHADVQRRLHDEEAAQSICTDFDGDGPSAYDSLPAYLASLHDAASYRLLRRRIAVNHAVYRQHAQFAGPPQPILVAYAAGERNWPVTADPSFLSLTMCEVYPPGTFQPLLSQQIRSRNRRLALPRLLVTALDALAWRDRYGDWPAELASLGGDPTLRRDPCAAGEAPFGWRREADGGLRIWSLDWDGADQGGLADGEPGLAVAPGQPVCDLPVRLRGGEVTP